MGTPLEREAALVRRWRRGHLDRDPFSEQQVVEVRRRWARIQKRAQKGR